MYNLYLSHHDLSISKYKVKTSDLSLLYKQLAEHIIIDGFNKGFTIDKQICKYKAFIDKIYKLKVNCYKIKASDYLMYLSCYLCLYKLNNCLIDEPIILKIKKRKSFKSLV